MSQKNTRADNMCFLNFYECTLLIISHIMVLVAFFISPLVGAETSILNTVTSLIGVWGIILISKGNYFAHYVYIVFSVLYSIVSITARYYGEAIIYFFIMLPIHIFSVRLWKRNNISKTVNEVKTKNITTKHIILSCIVAVSLSVPFYFALEALNTDNILFSTLSLSTSVLAAYLMMRRVKFFSVIFAIDDLFLVMLWGSKIFLGKYQYLPTLIVYVSALINDIYSAACWLRRSRFRKE